MEAMTPPSNRPLSLAHTGPGASEPATVLLQAALPDMPSETPLDMPVRPLDAPFVSRLAKGEIPETSPGNMALRRFCVLGLASIAAILGTWQMASALGAAGFTLLEVMFIPVFGLLFGWAALSFFSFAIGICVWLWGKDDLGLTEDSPVPILRSRTAILAPVCNEDMQGVAARLEAMYQSLVQTGQGAQFDIFILSDSKAGEAADAEAAAFESLRRLRPVRQAHRGAPRFFYRRRTENIDRKAGNIADWVRRHGDAYAHMVVLDADSLMTGDTLVRLAGAMERHQGVGLIQTVPVLINRTSLFARCEQFAARLYGPAASCGMAWWAGSESNYWGHNAIIRTRAFAESAGLPHLKGSAPFGGHILSHDFVEAALLRRAGWAIHLAPRLGGSYEECPPNLVDALDRDRRWCQGNLQHLAVVGAPGLHWVSRFHMLHGVANYLIAPLWLSLMMFGTLLTLSPDSVSRNAVPVLQVMLAVSFCFLLLPKMLACAISLSNERLRKGMGGPFKAIASVVVETVLSTLITPITMLSHTFILFSVLSGRKSGWKSQRRCEYELEHEELTHRFGVHTYAGLALLALAILTDPAAMGFTATSAAGLLFSIPLIMTTSRATTGIWSHLFRIPEEHHAPMAHLTLEHSAEPATAQSTTVVRALA